MVYSVTRDSRSTGLLSFIRSQALDLAVEESKTLVCPFCEEDWEREGQPSTWRPTRSFKITRTTSALLYLCYRVSCDAKGIIGDSIPLASGTSGKQFQAKFVDATPVALSQQIYNQHLKKYETSLQQYHDHGVMYVPERHALYFKLWIATGYQMGEQLKYLEQGHKPKSLTLRNVDHPVCSFYMTNTGWHNTLVAVEDCLSAIKVSQYVDSIALCGTNIPDELLLHIVHSGYERVFLMLDADAAHKASKLCLKIKPFFEYCNVIPVSADPKDTQYPVLQNLLRTHGVIDG